MSGWRRAALEAFPEHSSKLQTGDLIDAQFLLGDRLVETLKDADYASAHRIVVFALWLRRHSASTDRFYYAAIDIFRDSIKREPIRSELWKSISQAEFDEALPIFSEIFQRDISKEFEREFRFTLRP